MGYSLGLWGIIWELPEYILGYSLGAPILCPKVYSRLYPGIGQNIPGYSSVGVNLCGYIETIPYLLRMTSRIVCSTQYHRQQCTLRAFEQLGALFMHSHDDKYPARLGFEPGTSRLQAPVDKNEPVYPVNTKHLYNICTIMDQRRSLLLWAYIKLA